MDFKKSVIMHTFMAVVFFFSGLIINFLQCALYLLLYKANRRLYRKINYYLIYTSWSQIVAMTEWWSKTHCRVYGDDISLKLFGREHAMVVMNHKYDIDWLMCWFVCDKIGMLGNAKTCAKQSLKYVPVIGWGWVFAEMIFLERSWEKDRLTFGAKLDNLISYEDPILLLVFSEGTRFTAEKHKASMKFANERNLPNLKHHLLPRTRGFNFSAAHLKSKTDAIYDVQLAFPNGAKPTFFDLLCGYSYTADMHIRRIPISEIPTDCEEATSAWLYSLYQSKDQLVDDYLKTNRFPGKCIEMERTPCSLLNALFWMFIVGIPFAYVIFVLLTCGNLWIQALAATGLVLVFTALNLMIGVTKADKGSSYGKTTQVKNEVYSSSNNGVSSDTSGSDEGKEKVGLAVTCNQNNSNNGLNGNL